MRTSVPIGVSATQPPRGPPYLECRPPRLLAVAAVEFRPAHKPLDGLGEVRHLLRAGVVAVALERAQVRVAEVVERATVLAKLGQILLEVLDVAARGGRETEQKKLGVRSEGARGWSVSARFDARSYSSSKSLEDSSAIELESHGKC